MEKGSIGKSLLGFLIHPMLFHAIPPKGRLPGHKLYSKIRKTEVEKSSSV